MVTLNEFKRLERKQQTDATWQLGEQVAIRITDSHQILLWVIEDFYVELFYNYREGKVEKLKSFRNPDLLFRYLKQIDISALFR
jgi:hypothetical protein